MVGELPAVARLIMEEEEEERKANSFEFLFLSLFVFKGRDFEERKVQYYI